MALKNKKDSDKKVSTRERKSASKNFLVLRSERLGSNPDGSAKAIYTKGETIQLSDKKKIKDLKSIKII